MNPSVSVIIVNFNGADYVFDAIESALRQRYDGTVEVIVVDNGSTDDSPRLLAERRDIRLIRNPSNGGFGAGANVALSSVSTDFIALLNPDAHAAPDWLSEIVPWMRDGGIDFASSVISAGSATYFAGGRFVETLGATLEIPAFTGKTDWLSGCALVATRSAMTSLDFFDDGFFLYYEDVDLTLRAVRSGFRLGIFPKTLVDHPAHGRSTGTLGGRKAEIAYYSRGRLVAKHVRGWRQWTALAFGLTISPLRNRVGWGSLFRVGSATLRGFRQGRAVSRKTRTKSGKRPRIGVLLNIYERGSGLGAGGHRHFIEVIRRWDHVDLVLFGPESARAAIARELPSASYVVLPSMERAGKAADFLFRSVAWLGAFPKLRRSDALLATSHFLPDVVPAILSGRPTVVIIHHLMGASGMAIRSSPIPRLSEEAALAFVRFGARAVLVSSNLVASLLRHRGFTMPIDVTSSGVDHIPLPTSNASNDLRDGALFIGRMHPAKGALDAVRTWRHVVDIEPDAVLTIVGAREVEEYAREVEEYVAYAGMTRNVDIRGQLPEAEKNREMMRAKLFLFPSHEEGWGIAIAEAMRVGLPCVTYDLPIFAEIFPRGRLEAPVGDTAALARHVVSILNDEELRLKLSSDAAALAAEFSWSRAAAIEREAVNAFIVS